MAARIGAFKACCCYAKITPAASHRSDFWDHGIEQGEAVGRGFEFRSGNSCAALMARRVSSPRAPRWHEVEHCTPYA
jgi:hypothetical protein